MTHTLIGWAAILALGMMLINDFAILGSQGRLGPGGLGGGAMQASGEPKSLFEVFAGE